MAPEGESDLARCRTRQELAKGYEIAVARLVDPPSPADELIAKVSEVGDGAAEGRHPEFEEGREHLGDVTESGRFPALGRLRRFSCRIDHQYPLRRRRGSG